MLDLRRQASAFTALSAILAAASCSSGGSGAGAAPSAIGFDAAALTISEDVGTSAVALTLAVPGGGSLAEDSSVWVSDVGSGSATSGVDYATFAPVTVVFPAGSVDGTRRYVLFSIIDDMQIEGAAETLVLGLSNPSGATLGSNTSTTLSLDESKLATLSFLAAMTSTPDESSATYSAQVELVLPAGTSLDAGVQASVGDALTGTAAAGADYTSVPTTTVAFPAGSASGTTASVDIVVIDDALTEGDESVRLILAQPSPGAVLAGGSTFQLNISDDEVVSGPFLYASQGSTGVENPLGPGSGIWLGSQSVGVGPNAGTLVRLENIGTADFALAAPNLAGSSPQDFSIELESASLPSLPTGEDSGSAGFQLPPDVPAPVGARLGAGARGAGFELDLGLLQALELLPAATLHGFPMPNGQDVTLALERVALPFSADARLVIDGQEHPGGPRALVAGLTLWSGSALELPDSRVFLAFTRESVQGFVELPDTNDPIVHVVTESSADGSGGPTRVLVAEEWQLQALGLQAPPDLCAGALSIPGAAGLPGTPGSAPRPDQPPTSELTLADCRLAVETDFQLYQVFGDSTALTNYVTALIGAVASQYVTDVQATLSIAYLGIYTTPLDPWSAQDSGGNSSAVLSEFRSAWNSSGWPVAADLAHFLSGANLGGGVAYVDVLCNSSFGYGVSGNIAGNINWGAWTGQPASFTWDFVVLAHELGHNFGTSHTHSYCPPLDQCSSNCSGTTKCSTGTIMSYCHTCVGGMNNIRLQFHPQVANVMRAAVNTSCLGYSVLPAGDFVQYLVRFDPQSSSGMRSAALEFSHAAPNHPTPLQLQLQGMAEN